VSARQQSAGVVLVLLLALAAYGLFRTNPTNNSPLGVSGGSFSSDLSSENRSNGAAALVDQTPLIVAQRLVPLAAGDDERPLAQEALRLSDQEVDFAFASALRNAKLHPPVLTPEAQELQQTLADAQSAVDNDKALVDRLTAAEAKASGNQKFAAGDELEIAKAQLELDNDEVEDAKQDLIRAGGDPQGRIQAMVAEHEAAVKDTPASPSGPDTSLQAGGLVHRVYQWYSLREKHVKLRQAQQSAVGAAAALASKHDNLVAQMSAKKSSTVVTEKSGSKTGSQPGQPSNETSNSPTARPRVSVSAEPPARTHEQAAVVVKVTKERSAQQNELANYDKRIQTYKDLAAVYDRWIDAVAAKQQRALRLAIWGCTIILFILLLGMVFSSWLETLLGRLPLARRQLDTLRAVVRLALQIVAVLLTLLVIFGLPTQLGTFLGLAGAGLTVALKDFIVGFVGWFVLMGRNGIRIGDWVEINGVTGEVVELGMFHTVLLETGNWTDSGHPTGRRVTFTNSFAIEGHYFNFSTSGQWLWDELQIVLPTGKDPFPIVEAIQNKVAEATAESAGLAEKEWAHAARSRDMSALSAAPAINVKPVIGGVELSVRYITRANERYQLRAALYQLAVDMLAGKEAATSSNFAPLTAGKTDPTLPELTRPKS
jgi:small-conductance mechanosensitive channel